MLIGDTPRTVETLNGWSSSDETPAPKRELGDCPFGPNKYEAPKFDPSAGGSFDQLAGDWMLSPR
jgi:hypothetical protein